MGWSSITLNEGDVSHGYDFGFECRVMPPIRIFVANAHRFLAGIQFYYSSLTGQASRVFGPEINQIKFANFTVIVVWIR